MEQISAVPVGWAARALEAQVAPEQANLGNGGVVPRGWVGIDFPLQAKVNSVVSLVCHRTKVSTI